MSEEVKCCFVGCKKTANWELWYGLTTDSVTESCDEHIAGLMADGVEHKVHRIPRLVPKGEVITIGGPGGGGGCSLAGPGRGDCEHFVGLPEKFDETTTDVYGKPNDWCWLCWLSTQLSAVREERDRLITLLDRIRAVACGEEQIQCDGDYDDSDGLKWIYDIINEAEQALSAPEPGKEQKDGR